MCHFTNTHNEQIISQFTLSSCLNGTVWVTQDEYYLNAVHGKFFFIVIKYKDFFHQYLCNESQY